jgi:hypothetical protein
MRGLDDDRDAKRPNFFFDGRRDLRGEPLLHLQAPRKRVDDAWDLAQANHLAIRNVGDVSFAEERQQVMLAEAVQIDVADDDHFVVRHGEERAVDHIVDVDVVAAREKLQRLLHPTRCLQQPLAGWVFAKRGEQLPNQVLHGIHDNHWDGIAG